MQKSEDIKFDTNFSGVDILSYIGEIANSGVIPNKYFYDDMIIGKFHVKTKMDDAECKATASAIRNLSEDQINKIYDVVKELGLFSRSGSVLDFKEFVNEWCTFLENCKGCDAN